MDAKNHDYGWLSHRPNRSLKISGYVFPHSVVLLNVVPHEGVLFAAPQPVYFLMAMGASCFVFSTLQWLNNSHVPSKMAEKYCKNEIMFYMTVSKLPTNPVADGIMNNRTMSLSDNPRMPGIMLNGLRRSEIP